MCKWRLLRKPTDCQQRGRQSVFDPVVADDGQALGLTSGQGDRWNRLLRSITPSAECKTARWLALFFLRVHFPVVSDEIINLLFQGLVYDVELLGIC